MSKSCSVRHKHILRRYNWFKTEEVFILRRLKSVKNSWNWLCCTWQGWVIWSKSSISYLYQLFLWKAMGAEAYPTLLWVKDGVHPGQNASLSQGNQHKNMKKNVGGESCFLILDREKKLNGTQGTQRPTKLITAFHQSNPTGSTAVLFRSRSTENTETRKNTKSKQVKKVWQAKHYTSETARWGLESSGGRTKLALWQWHDRDVPVGVLA